MATKCYNKAGGKYSGAALSAFVGSTFGDCVGGKTDMKVTKKVGMQVAVAPGVALIGKGEAYPYIVENDSEITFTIDREPTDDRTDSIVAYVDNSVSAGTDVIDNTGKGILKIVVVKGSPMGEPSYPPIPSMIQKAIGAGNPYIILANVTVSAGASELTDSPKFFQDMRDVASIVKPGDIANGAVGGDQVDYRSCAVYGKSAERPVEMTNNYITMATLEIPSAGVYEVSGVVAFNKLNDSSIGNVYIRVPGEGPTEVYLNTTGWVVQIPFCCVVSYAKGTRVPVEIKANGGQVQPGGLRVVARRIG